MRNNADSTYVWHEENPEHFLYEFSKRNDIKHVRYKVYRHNGTELSFHVSGRKTPLPESWEEMEKLLKEKPYDVVMVSAYVNDGESLVLTNNYGTKMVVTACKGTYSKNQMESFIKNGIA